MRKRFGQHFLVDDYIVDQIIELIRPQRDEYILEIGPGGGVLTEPLIASGAQLSVVEIDRDLAAALELKHRQTSSLTIHTQDILTLDLALATRAADSWKAVGNLPYNISTALILRLLEFAGKFHEMTFMVQREVAERIAAEPGTRSFGRLSVMAQRRATIKLRLDVPPESFMPPPKVDSAVVQLVPLTLPPEPQFEQTFADLVRLAFAQRRKTISNALRGHFDKRIFLGCHVDPSQRAESLSVADFERLARAVHGPTG